MQKVSPRTPSLTDAQNKASFLFLHHSCDSSSVPTVIYNLLLSVHIYVHHTHTLSVSRYADRHAYKHTHHPQEELQVLRGNPACSERLVNGIVNFLKHEYHAKAATRIWWNVSSQYPCDLDIWIHPSPASALSSADSSKAELAALIGKASQIWLAGRRQLNYCA